MNLRHKKPINSYRGQANNDKNEFNDDDFKHQPSPSKKFSGSTGEQMYKYSKILAKFIMNANQFYRNKDRNPKKPKSEIENIIEEAKVTRDESRNSKYAKRVQQPKQKRKIMSKIQNEKLQIKELKQKESYKIDSQSKQIKDLQESQPSKIISKNPPLVKTNVPTPQPPQPKIEPLPKQKKTVTPPVPQNFMNMYGQGMPIAGFPNPAIFTNMPINQYMGCYEQMMRLQMLQQLIKNEQLKGMNIANFNPQFMANMMANADLMNMKQNMYQNYMRGMTPPQAPVVAKKTPPIYNLTQVYLSQKQSIFNDSKQKPNEMAKRANFHVGIAYHIYLTELNRKNINLSDLDLIDPTRQSRQIKAKQYGPKKYPKQKVKK